MRFLSTPSARRATRFAMGKNHHSRFLSTPSARRATWALLLSTSDQSNFYPRPPRGGRLVILHVPSEAFPISIHALREEGDAAPMATAFSMLLFLSTPSARRATDHRRRSVAVHRISIHALREEGDARDPHDVVREIISIHALREEGDHRLQQSDLHANGFLSTPSARRATRICVVREMILPISIHALREEGDHPARFADVAIKQFLSTPSARRATLC